MILYSLVFSILLPAPMAFYAKKINITRGYTYFFAFIMPILPVCIMSFQEEQLNNLDEHAHCGMFLLVQMIFTVLSLFIFLPISLILQSNFNEMFGVLRKKENE
jgi:hypothetical protein